MAAEGLDAVIRSGADEDRRIAARFLAGDRQALAVLDDWILRAAARFRRCLGSDWDDALQTARLEVVTLLQQGRHRGAARLRTYLWQAVRHTCIDVLRRRGRRRIVELGEPHSTLPDPAGSPLDAVLVGERQRAGLAALHTLPPDGRRLFGLLLDGLTWREVGRRLGISEGAARVRAHRCRKAATRALGRATAATR